LVNAKQQLLDQIRRSRHDTSLFTNTTFYQVNENYRTLQAALAAATPCWCWWNEENERNPARNHRAPARKNLSDGSLLSGARQLTRGAAVLAVQVKPRRSA
jgi:hypothetical protein